MAATRWAAPVPKDGFAQGRSGAASPHLLMKHRSWGKGVTSVK